MGLNFVKTRGESSARGYYNEGLRDYMLKVYNYMAGALAVTGIVAYLVSSSDYLLGLLYGTPLHWVVAFAPLIYVFFFHSRIPGMTMQGAQTAFFAFSVLMGLSLSWVFVLYTGISIARVFFVAASMFGAMSYYGNATSRDLTSAGSFFFMGLIGVLIASLINIFMQSSALHFAISVVSVLVFAGLTAYDVQYIKSVYFRLSGTDSCSASKAAILGATTLYFDFINIFISLMQLFGDRR